MLSKNEEKDKSKFVIEQYNSNQMKNRNYPSEQNNQGNSKHRHIKSDKAPITHPFQNLNNIKTSYPNYYGINSPHNTYDLREKDGTFLKHFVRQNGITERTVETSGLMFLQVFLNLIQLIGIVVNSALGRFIFPKYCSIIYITITYVIYIKSF